MTVRASFFGVPAKPNHAAIAALIEAACLSVRQEMFGRETLQFSHAGQFTLDIQLGDSTHAVLHFPNVLPWASKHIGTAVTVSVQIVRNW
jgi:hypothetical protein